MKKFVCASCEYVYDRIWRKPTSYLNDWQCFICFVGKNEFEPVEA